MAVEANFSCEANGDMRKSSFIRRSTRDASRACLLDPRARNSQKAEVVVHGDPLIHVRTDEYPNIPEASEAFTCQSCAVVANKNFLRRPLMRKPGSPPGR